MAVVGTVVALGAAFDLWLSSVSFGGRDDPSVGVGSMAVHSTIIVLAAGLPLITSRLLLGRVPAVAAVAVVVVTVMLCLGVLGVSL
jgi:hypothetical protein